MALFFIDVIPQYEYSEKHYNLYAFLGGHKHPSGFSFLKQLRCDLNTSCTDVPLEIAYRVLLWHYKFKKDANLSG